MSTKTPETDDKFEYLMRFLSLTQGWEAAGKMRDFARSLELRNAELTARIAEQLAELNVAHNALDLAAQRFDTMDQPGFRDDCMHAILPPATPLPEKEAR